ncbi:hypothetical protein [Krasilnikovia sp. MM14-A1259]|uniref:hypothetical protein n=1 Tax=Krasilnikovia sp. MM14-A1259 TaxID=3373539 RepID=UPI0037F4DD38
MWPPDLNRLHLAPVAPERHQPRWRSTATTTEGPSFTFAAFDGTEPEPVVPARLAEENDDAYQLPQAEYRAAHALWCTARYRAQLAALIRLPYRIGRRTRRPGKQ